MSKILLDKNFIFITREGRKDPGARARSWGFSEQLNEKGFRSSVVSFVENLGAKSGGEDANFTLLEKIIYAFKGYKFLLKKANNPIFIINRFNYHTIPVWILSKIKKIPFIFDMDDWEAREDISNYFGVFPRSKAEYLTRKLASESICCIAASNYLKDYLSKQNKKVYYLPSGVDIKEFYPSFSAEEKKKMVFSWHGTLNRIEILDYIKFIIDCFLVLYRKYPFIKLFIAGEGTFDGQLAMMIEKYRCNGIVYQRWIKPENISEYLDEVDVGLVPLFDTTKFNLSKSPVKLFEYMAKGKPVIASAVGEANFIIQSGYSGLLSYNKEEFLSNMELMISDRNLAKTIGINGLEVVRKKYSLNLAGDKLYSIIADNISELMR